MKELWMEQFEEDECARTWKAMGLSEEELDLVDWEIEADTSDDGSIYGYIATFTEDSDPEILERLGAENRVLRLSASFFDNLDGYVDQEELFWEVHSDDHFGNFFAGMEGVQALVDDTEEKPADLQFTLRVMIYLHIVSSLENLLYLNFLRRVSKNPALARKLIESDPILKEQKFSLAEIFKKYEKIEAIVANHIKGIIFHNVAKIKMMYRDVLGFDFGEIGWLGSAVSKRHDCAHRAGYDKEGNKIEITKGEIETLLSNARTLALNLESRETNRGGGGNDSE